MPENDEIVISSNYTRSLQYDEYYNDFKKEIICTAEIK